MGTIQANERSFAADRWSGASSAALQLIASALGWALSAYLRAQSRRDLAGLDDRALRDIGLSRADVTREAAKPFWR